MEGTGVIWNLRSSIPQYGRTVRGLEKDLRLGILNFCLPRCQSLINFLIAVYVREVLEGGQGPGLCVFYLPIKGDLHSYDSRRCVCDFLPFVAYHIKPMLHALLQFSQRRDTELLLDLTQF